jgi:hypothetical protein
MTIQVGLGVILGLCIIMGFKGWCKVLDVLSNYKVDHASLPSLKKDKISKQFSTKVWTMAYKPMQALNMHTTMKTTHINHI